jgi:membrane protein DedA with SNARE-associated domain
MAQILDPDQIAALLSNWGYGAVGVVIALESAGLPLPGETLLIGAAIYARLTGSMTIGAIVGAAAIGAILGDNFGYWIGRRYGVGFLERHGARLGLGPDKFRLSQYLFYRWGGAVVFLGRFITLLRIFAALLAGANRLPFKQFLLYNAAGGVVWASIFGFGAYYLTAGFEKVEGGVARFAFGALLASLLILWRYYRRHEARLMQEADALFIARAGRED